MNHRRTSFACVIACCLGAAVVSCRKGSQPSAAEPDAAVEAGPSAADHDGHARDAFALWDGANGKKDPTAAKKMFGDACARGSQLGCTGLGIAYLDGIDGTGKDYKLAFANLRSACEAGIPRACSAFGSMYASGFGTAKDEAKAADLFSTSCERGEQRGCVRLALFYATGSGGLPKDLKRATDLLKKACDAGNAAGCAGAADILRAAKASPAEAMPYAERACEMKHGEGCSVLASLYGEKQDAIKQHEFAQRACDLDSASGCTALGALLLGGSGIAADHKKARAAAEKACERENPSALGCYLLATMWRRGWGGESNGFTADGYLKKSCDLGNPSACKDLRR